MTNTLNDLSSALQSYIVSPLNAFGLGGFVFDVLGESMATSSADITDHYTEDNKALQDHIAIRPKKVTLKGYVGELIYNGAGGEDTNLQVAVQKLTEIDAFLPQISIAAVQAQTAIAGANNAGITPNSFSALIPPSANIYRLVKNAIGAFGTTQKQQSAYQYFAACQAQGILMGIQTPWEFLSNMAIETLVAIQTEESIFVTDFSVTFKQIRIAETLTATSILTGTGGIISSAGTSSQGVAGLQGQAATNNGVVPGIPMPTTASVLSAPAQAAMTNGTSFLNENIAPIYNYLVGQ